jgi:hypothetical protein
MSAHVNFERARAHEGLAADCAFKWPVPRVPTEVVRQMTLGSECLLAPGYGTHKWLLA